MKLFATILMPLLMSYKELTVKLVRLSVLDFSMFLIFLNQNYQ